MSSNAWTILLVAIPTLGILLAAWLLSRWEPLNGATFIVRDNDVKAIEMRTQ